MQLRNKIISIFLTLITGLIFLGAGKEPAPKKYIKHTAKVYHKGVSDKDPVLCNFYEVEDKKVHTNFFYTDVESVICGSKVCKIVPVRLFWNELGQFTHYELKPNVYLEKEDGKLFTKGDYERLLEILKDLDSPLKNYYKEELVSESNHNAADALSGATIEIDPNAVIEGSVWTCYTLWHWANGELVSYIRDITAKKLSNEDLRNFLKYGDVNYRLFALESIIKRNVYDDITIKTIVDAVKINSKLSHIGLEYFEKSTEDIYYNNILQLFQNGNVENRILFLNSIQNIPYKSSLDFHNHLSFELTKSKNYQEANLILNIIEKKSSSSKEIIENTFKLLENEIFLIARRAYWYLINQKDLAKPQKKLLNKFRKRNKKFL